MNYLKMIGSKALPALANVKENCQALFKLKFGDAPQTTVAVPARLELVGHHLDYLEGPTWCGAVNIYDTVSMSCRTDKKIVMHAIGCEGESHFDQTTLSDCQKKLQDPQVDPIFRYILSVIIVCNRYSWVLDTGINISMKLDIPYGAGLGSSAAICVGVTKALQNIHFMPKHDDIDNNAVVHICEVAERNLGVKCGKLDMTAELSAEEGCIGVFDPNKLYSWILYNMVTLSDDFKFVLINFTNQKHNNRSAGLNDLVQEHRALESKLFELSPLNDPETAVPLCLMPEPIFMDPPKGLSDRQLQLIRRCANERKLVDNVINMANAYALSPDKLGMMLNKSFENSLMLGNVTELQKEAYFIATHLKGVYGAKIHGAGFGGVMLLLVDPNVFNDTGLSIICNYLSHCNEHENSNIDMDVYEVKLVAGVSNQHEL